MSRESQKKSKRTDIAEADLLAVIAIASVGELSRDTSRYVASYASPHTFRAMLDREIEFAGKDDPKHYSFFSPEELPSLLKLRAVAESNPDSLQTIPALDKVLTRLIGFLHDPMFAIFDTQGAITLIATESFTALCDVITTEGPLARKVQAINVLRKIYPHLPSDVQAKIQSSLDRAIEQAPDSKKVAAAVAAAKAEMKSSTTLTTAKQPPATIEAASEVQAAV